jgi:hypothetical protein
MSANASTAASRSNGSSLVSPAVAVPLGARSSLSREALAGALSLGVHEPFSETADQRDGVPLSRMSLAVARRSARAMA